MKLTRSRFLQLVTGTAAAAMFSSVATFSSAQDISAELEAWLLENSLGPNVVEEENWDDIVAAATEEGEVVIYSSSGRIAKLVDHFQALYPGITLTLFDLGSVKTIEKAIREQEAGIFNVDVITTGNSGQVIYELLGNNRIFNYVPAHFVDRIPEENRDPLLIRVNEAIVFFYNTDANPDGAPISNVWELTEERFRGRVGIKDPMGSGSSLMGLAALVQNPDEMAAAYQRLTGEEIVLGDGVPDAGYEFVRRMLENDIVIFKSGSKLADAAGAAGQDDAMIAMTNMTYISRNDDKGNVNAMMVDLDPVARMVYPTYMAIAANAPNPNAAKVLIAYLLGNPEMNLETELVKPYIEGDSFDMLQGLAPYHDAGSVSPRSDVPLPQGGEVWDDMVGWDISAEFMWEQGPQLRDFWMIHSSQ
ncbi:MAG: substrate-binding domain-containing protein [Rhodobacteraceae bacterium]|nr:substrate-binding domain-containing protein [Paracoccaceae bacterium]